MLKYAHNNGDTAIEVVLCHRDKAQLQADIKTIEDSLEIEVSRTRAAVAVAASAI